MVRKGYNCVLNTTVYHPETDEPSKVEITFNWTYDYRDNDFYVEIVNMVSDKYWIDEGICTNAVYKRIADIL
jgi:hypothetical protein